MVCSHCPKTALYRVGGRGYCRDHYAEAQKSTALHDKVRREASWHKRWDQNDLNLGQIDMARGGSLTPVDARKGPGLKLGIQKTRKRAAAGSVRGGKRIYDKETRPRPDYRKMPRA